jgi:hypothetical protein
MGSAPNNQLSYFPLCSSNLPSILREGVGARGCKMARQGYR